MNRPKAKSEAQLYAEVNGWNTRHRVGTGVTVTMDDGMKLSTYTTSPAWLMGGHSAVIKVNGISGGYSLDRVQPLKLETQEVK